MKPAEMLVYVDTAGNNSNSGDSLNPVSDFVTAMQIIKDSTANRTGEVYAEVVFYPGTYGTPLGQGVGNYEVGSRFLNISVRGKGEVILDERLTSGSNATAMIHLLGSHISVKNIRIAYCHGSGTLFGLLWSNYEIIPHDILVQNVALEGGGNHGIFAGLGRFPSNQQTSPLPWLERVMYENCTVTNSVNHNDMSQTAWGSAFKFHYVKHGIMRNCLSYNNAGEGINLDDCNTVLIEGCESHDNRASVYFDKAENVVFRNNLMYSTFRPNMGLLLSTEVGYASVTNHYLRNIYVYNNIFINTTSGVGYWMGTVSAIQKSILQNLQICNNTFVGKRKTGMGMLNFAYEKNPFNPNAPAGNVQMSNILWQANIVSFADDSVGKVFTHPINPQPGLTTKNNLYHYITETHFNTADDSANTGLPRMAEPDSLEGLIPAIHRVEEFIVDGPLPDYIRTDYFGRSRRTVNSNVGAIEWEEVLFVYQQTEQQGCDSLITLQGDVIYTSQNRTDTLHGFLQDTIVTASYVVYQSIAQTDSTTHCKFALWQGDTLFGDTILVDSLQTIHGCDSILTHHFMVNDVQVSLFIQNDTLFLNTTAESVLWVNCDNGATWKDSTGFISQNGTYKAVAVSIDCADSTECFTLEVTYVGEITKEKLCPPLSGEILFDANHTSEEKWTIYNIQGQEIRQSQSFELRKGMYLIRNKDLPWCKAYKVVVE